jgi:prevent-host-death family protein
MRSVGIRQLKDRLSEYVRLAEAGETVLVTDRDRPVARLSPLTAEDRRVVDDPLAELVRQGIATPATAPPGTVPPSFHLIGLEKLMRDLNEDRADRW